MSEPEEQKLDCHKFKDQLDSLIEAMVEARLGQEIDSSPGSAEYSFEPEGALKQHLDSCADCHNYQLANRVIIEAARALPKFKGDEALTQAILAMVQESQEAEHLELAETSTNAAANSIANPTVPEAVSSAFSPRSLCLLAASFIAFALITSGFNTESIWSVGSWALALLAVALTKPLIEGKLHLATSTNSMAKA